MTGSRGEYDGGEKMLGHLKGFEAGRLGVGMAWHHAQLTAVQVGIHELPDHGSFLFKNGHVVVDVIST